MSEENRRVSTTPIPVPMPFGVLPTVVAPTPSPLSQTPVAGPPPATEAVPNTSETAIDGASKDVTMTDAEQAPSPAPPTNNASPAPARTGTPLRTNGVDSNSRAASQQPDRGFTMPVEAPLHGAPVRQYLNTKVTGAVLEGMKLIAKEQPKDPLRALGEFLLRRSKEVETPT
ncbi:hypothetical protein BJ170DRAFT_684983 [Xylariales sp. AK1849]|nr:hypothetical protein BJ170DRAFT_684983 [Xylariales sp. AK1849]